MVGDALNYANAEALPTAGRDKSDESAVDMTAQRVGCGAWLGRFVVSEQIILNLLG